MPSGSTLRQGLGPLLVEGEVHGPQLVGMSVRAYWMARAAARSSRSTNTSTTWRRRSARRRLRHVLELLGFGLVLAVQADEERDHDRHEHDDDPRAVGELGDGDDDVDDQRQHRADPVDDEPAAPVRLLLAQVVAGHARLGQREPREHADRVERDEPVDLGAGDDEEHDGDARQEDDAVREHQAMAALVNCRGMKLSSAWKLASRGKSAKLVLAASTRISIVPACSQ